MKTRKVKPKWLILGIAVELLFAIVMGYTGGALGIGAWYPPVLTFLARPFVCPNGEMTYTQHQSQIGSETYTTVSFFCADEQTGETITLDPDKVALIATPFFSVLVFATFLAITYGYWYSGVGPAKNEGLYLW